MPTEDGTRGSSVLGLLRRKSSASFTKLETTVAKLESSASHQLERVATIGLEIPIEMKLAADICELLKLGAAVPVVKALYRFTLPLPTPVRYSGAGLAHTGVFREVLSEQIDKLAADCARWSELPLQSEPALALTLSRSWSLRQDGPCHPRRRRPSNLLL